MVLLFNDPYYYEKNKDKIDKNIIDVSKARTAGLSLGAMAFLTTTLISPLLTATAIGLTAGEALAAAAWSKRIMQLGKKKEEKKNRMRPMKALLNTVIPEDDDND